jgi:hypothetical protein
MLYAARSARVNSGVRRLAEGKDTFLLKNSFGNLLGFEACFQSGHGLMFKLMASLRRIPMKRLTVFALLLLSAPYAVAQAPDSAPQPGVKKTARLSQSYSCRSVAEFYKGYEGTALFLSDSMKRHNSPDLLFNGACGSEDYFESGTHGGNQSLIADLVSGTTAPQLLTLIPPDGELSPEVLKTLEKLGFKEEVPVVSGHTYAVLLDKHGVRGLFVFTVTDYVKNSRVKISYEVLDYRVTEEESKARGSARRRRP